MIAEGYVISIAVKYLLQQGIEYFDGDLERIKKDCEQYIVDEIGPWWLEQVALSIFDGAWDIILGEVKKQLVAAKSLNGMTRDQIDNSKARSNVTKHLLEEFGKVA